MFKTKRVKELEKEIDHLYGELWAEQEKTRVSAYVEAAALPKCTSLACLNCSHLAYQSFPGHSICVLGCGKDTRCPDFSPADRQISETVRQEIQTSLLRQLTL